MLRIPPFLYVNIDNSICADLPHICGGVWRYQRYPHIGETNRAGLSVKESSPGQSSSTIVI